MAAGYLQMGLLQTRGMGVEPTFGGIKNGAGKEVRLVNV